MYKKTLNRSRLQNYFTQQLIRDFEFIRTQWIFVVYMYIKAYIEKFTLLWRWPRRLRSNICFWWITIVIMMGGGGGVAHAEMNKLILFFRLDNRKTLSLSLTP